MKYPSSQNQKPPLNEQGETKTKNGPTPKSRRCYHRVISGLEKGGNFRFLTLTSSNDSPDSCQRDWRVLYARLHRRGLIQAYIKVPELSKNGKQHLHIIFRGEFIAQAAISEMWQQIHKAKIVDIRQVSRRRTKPQLASYMAKYLSKDNLFRYSWSWSWVWKGFVKDWERLKRAIRDYCEHSGSNFMPTLLFYWHFALKRGPDLLFQRLDDLGLNLL